jgi:hypothetical protein
MEEKKMHAKFLIRKPEGQRPLGSPRRRWEYIIKTNLQSIRWKYVGWNDLVHDRNKWRALVNAVMNLRFP